MQYQAPSSTGGYVVDPAGEAYTLGSAPPSPPPLGASTQTSAPLSPPPPFSRDPYRPSAHVAVSSPPLPPLPPHSSPPMSTVASGPHQPPSLASSLQQINNEAAFLPSSQVQQKHLQLSSSAPTDSQGDATARSSLDEDYIPGLMSPHLFVILPETDTLTPLVERFLGPFLPERDLSGKWQGKTVDELIAARRWHALAEFCHDAIMSSSAEKTSFLLGYWTLRLHCLLRLRLIEHFATELLGLVGILPPFVALGLPPPPSASVAPRFNPLIPFELQVMLATLPALRGDPERTVENLTVLLKNVKCEMWVCELRGEHDFAVEWKMRAENIAGMMAAALTEIKAHPSAAYLLTSGAPNDAPSPALLTALARLQIATGDLIGYSSTTYAAARSREQLDRATRKAIALGRVAKGDWVAAETEWRALVEEDKEDAEAVNNLAVVLLFASKLTEAMKLLGNLFSARPSMAFASETIAFNYATLLELRMEKSTAPKVNLLRGVIKHGGEEMRSTCLKLVV